ncbi:BTAD domain-containing putative transcriptional regulator [Actinoplanes sichuanensis]|uniref:BTAD domain-containing putative transcriptional regulator n=1 Tax=Actinoplanes sichuanensis TaxID=512349 RepID=A0ABW4A209_9ACTN|nr:BTAD domain-containing putative transcriptional regulator [Actinoplanes sichuanensis]BEL04287.1 BTAD domain-containing putative transcriptional regulator [Actinoplanes sichuanensis]
MADFRGAVEFRVLGDFEVRIGTTAMDVGHARQQRVLLALLVDANQVVSADQLTDRVWADRPPQRARGALYNYVSRLRRILNTADDVAITRRPGGYLLQVDAPAVDLHRFEQLTTRARAADDDEASALFARALGLWRGQAFAGLDSPWLDPARDAAHRRRTAAELDRTDVELRLGRHGELVPDLSVRAAASPLDERLAGQLMLALYRSGRQAEAVDTFQRTRSRLADELGIDPGPDLWSLHQRILTVDPALDVPRRPVIAGARVTPPRQLPAPPRSFRGRHDALARLDTIPADHGMPVVAVSGPAGVGKTSLAVHWAHRVADRYPDGQLYVNLHGFDPRRQATDPAEALRGFLEAFTVPAGRLPSGLDERATLYRSILAGRRVLVVLDNARDAEQVRPMLPGTPGCAAVVTSRNRLTPLVAAEGAHPVALNVLTVGESRELIAARLGADRVAAESGAVDEIIERCGRLPLALVIAAAAGAWAPLAELVTQLRDAAGVLDALDGGDASTDVRAVFSWSYRALSDGAARLFRLLALHAGPDIDVIAAAGLAGLGVAGIRPMLAELTRTHLLEHPAEGRFAFHDLLRWYARELAELHDSAVDRHLARQRMLDHYLHSADTAARRMDPHREPIIGSAPDPAALPMSFAGYEHALAWYTVERPVLLAAVGQAARTGFDQHAWRLAWTLMDYLDMHGYWTDLLTAQTTAMAAAERLGDRTGRAHAHWGLGRAHAKLGRAGDAHTHFTRALDLFEQVGDLTSQAHTHLNLAWSLDRQGRYAEALPHSRRAVGLYRSIGHVAGQADGLNSIGYYLTHLGHHRQALIHCRRSVALHQRAGDPRGEAQAWDSLGRVHMNLGGADRATECYLRAIDLIGALGLGYDETIVLTGLGDARRATGDLDGTRRAWQRALSILRRLDHPDADTMRARLEELSRLN